MPDFMLFCRFAAFTAIVFADKRGQFERRLGHPSGCPFLCT